ncbi:MAG: serine/threonine-protein phosphatase [Acidobacteria bacterium]|nr:serine/threonine-protein phosphatase [Acidobacteriota bacterium]
MAEVPTINLALYAHTDVGMVRSGNEDNFLILDLSSGNSWTASEEEPQELLTYSQGYYGSLLAVSDGMGGALAGEVASRMAVETVRDRMLQLQAHEVYGKVPFEERLRLAIEEANLLINDDGQSNPAHKGLGATFTAVATQGNRIYFAQVGDSRAYLIRQGKIYRVTKDQSLVQQMIDLGHITEEEAETHSYRNVILQALGANYLVNVEINSLEMCQLDTLVLCSDGLSGKINQDEIAQIVNKASDFKSACQTMINLANERGGEDNITVIIAQFSGSSLPVADDDAIEPQSLARSPDTPTEINWGIGAKTDPLNQSDLTDQKKEEISSKATEPLPPPPTQSYPFTSKLVKETLETTARTNDLSDRRGPITSVFAAMDFEEKPGVESSESSAADQRVTQPLASDESVSSPADPVYNKPSSSEPKKNHPADHPARRNSKGSLIIISGLVLLSAVALIVVLSLYLKKQSEQRTVQEQEVEKQNQKDGKISRLREKIVEINKRLQAIEKPSLRDKRESWEDSLRKLGTRLDGAAQMSPNDMQLINQVCDEIGNELKKIEDEVNNLQGLIPQQQNNRDPVKV